MAMYPRPESFIGKEVDGHRIDAVLGRGGMGIVFKAENLELSRTVALKIINPALAQDDSFIRRFRLEARALAQIHHPNIVLVYAFRPFDLGYYISMEYVHGPTLAEYMDARGALPWREVVNLLKQMLSAFHFAHSAGVIHRDIKPRNILLTANNIVKITDFGLAKVLQEGAVYGHDTTVTVATGGTIHYMPPEQIRGLKNVDHRGDIFSLGMSMYESLAGVLPFDKNASGYTIQKIIVEEPFPDLRKINPVIPRQLARIIMKSLEKDPEKRYQTAAEMRAALDEFEKEHFTSNASTVYVAGPQSSGVTLKTSKKRTSSIVAAAVVCLLLIFIVFYGGNRDSPASGESSGQTDPTTSFTLGEQTPSSSAETTPAGVNDGTLLFSNPHDSLRDIGDLLLGHAPNDPTDIPSVAGGVPATSAATGGGQTTSPTRLPPATSTTAAAGGPISNPSQLPPIEGSLMLNVSPSGSVYVNEELFAENVGNDYELKLPATTHSIAIKNPEYGEWRRDITIQANDPTIVSVDFTQTVRIVVTAHDLDESGLAAEIVLDGTPTGRYTPNRVEVPVGLHLVEVRAEGFEAVAPPKLMNFDSSLSGPLRFLLKKEPESGNQ